jgi:hypothetical protein
MSQHVFGLVEIYYNQVRRHSVNGWLISVELEKTITKIQNAWQFIDLTRFSGREIFCQAGNKGASANKGA